jgi:hypothetical protein
MLRPWALIAEAWWLLVPAKYFRFRVGLSDLECDVEKGAVAQSHKLIGGRHVLSTLPRADDRSRPERIVESGLRVGVAVPAVWRDDGLRDRGQSPESRSTESEPCTCPWFTSGQGAKGSMRGTAQSSEHCRGDNREGLGHDLAHRSFGNNRNSGDHQRGYAGC